jgi:hypothetical protein
VAEDELVEVDLPGAGARRRSGCLQSDNQQPYDTADGLTPFSAGDRPHLIEQLEVALEASRPRSAGFAAEVVGRETPWERIWLERKLHPSGLWATSRCRARARSAAPHGRPRPRQLAQLWPWMLRTGMPRVDRCRRGSSNGSAEGRMGQGPRLIAGENGHANAWRTMSMAGDCAGSRAATSGLAPAISSTSTASASPASPALSRRHR